MTAQWARSYLRDGRTRTPATDTPAPAYRTHPAPDYETPGPRCSAAIPNRCRSRAAEFASRTPDTELITCSSAGSSRASSV